MSPRKLVDRELSKEQILSAARLLFAAKGYQGVSMRDIAKELGYSHGAIYYHFKNKSQLFNELVQKGFELLNADMTQIVHNEHELKDILLGFVAFGFEHPHHYEIMFMTKEEAFLEHAAPIESYQRFEQEVGKFDVSSADIYFLFLALHGFIAYHLRSNSFFERGKTLAEQHVQFLLNCIP